MKIIKSYEWPTDQQLGYLKRDLIFWEGVAEFQNAGGRLVDVLLDVEEHGLSNTSRHLAFPGWSYFDTGVNQNGNRVHEFVQSDMDAEIGHEVVPFKRFLQCPKTGDMYPLKVVYNNNNFNFKFTEKFEFHATCPKTGWHGKWNVVDKPREEQDHDERPLRFVRWVRGEFVDYNLTAEDMKEMEDVTYVGRGEAATADNLCGKGTES